MALSEEKKNRGWLAPGVVDTITTGLDKKERNGMNPRIVVRDLLPGRPAVLINPQRL